MQSFRSEFNLFSFADQNEALSLMPKRPVRSNKGDFGSRAVEDFIRSLTMQLDGSHRIFSKRCPICGNRYAGEGDVHTCFYCESVWSLVEELGVEKVWLKRIRKEQKDDDDDEFEFEA